MKRTEGYTLIETLTVVAIIALLSVTVLANYNAGSDTRTLKQQVDILVGALNQAQQNALGAANLKRCSVTTTQSCVTSGNCPAGESCVGAKGYGVMFDSLAQTYTFFGNVLAYPHCSNATSTSCIQDSNCPPGGTCQSDPSYAVYGAANSSFVAPKTPAMTANPQSLPTGITMSLGTSKNLQGNSENCLASPLKVNVTYQAPEPSAVVSDGANSCAYACVFLKTGSPTPKDTWRIDIHRSSASVDYYHLTNPADTTCPYHCKTATATSCITNTDCPGGDSCLITSS